MNIQNIVALEQVAHDLNVGEDFYKRQNMGLGKYFRDTILSDIESWWLYEAIHQKVYGLYRLLSKRFPYTIYYDINDATVIVFAVLDLRQNPKNLSKFILRRSSSALKA